MKKSVLFVAVVFAFSLILSACGGGGTPITSDLSGKTGPKIEKGSSDTSRKVTFTFYLDKSGAEEVARVIKAEHKKAVEGKQAERAKTLEKILKEFTANKFGKATSIIKDVSVAGPFNGWKARKDLLTATKKGEKGEMRVYTITKEWEFATGKPPYKFVFGLNVGKSAADLTDIWVPDPLAKETVDDGFGGKNSILPIPGFGGEEKDKKEKKEKKA